LIRHLLPRQSARSSGHPRRRKTPRLHPRQSARPLQHRAGITQNAVRGRPMFFVGLDLGKRQDFSAVAVVEREMQRSTFHAPSFLAMRVRYLERQPLGTAYTSVVNRVAQIVRDPRLAGDARLVVDATGVGAPVVEMLRSARLGCRVTAVTITSGERAHGFGEEWFVPKKDLIASLQVLLEDGRLKIPEKLRES